jgi:hypothetical protein
VLRMGLATLMVFDSGVVITDAARKPDDYRAMGCDTLRHTGNADPLHMSLLSHE